MKKSKIDIRTMTVSSILIAMGTVLSFLRIPLSTVTEITLTGLPIAAGAYLFGPWMGFAIGALIDICGFMIAPKGAFFPGFTISTGLIGMIYGLFLYRNWWNRESPKKTLLRSGTKGLVIRIVLAHLIKTVCISLCLNCLWLSLFYGLSFPVVFFASLPKEIINLPIEAFLIFSIIRLLMRIRPMENTVRDDG